EFDIYLFIIFSIAMPPVTQRRLLTLALKRSRHYSHYRSAPRLIFHLLDNQITLEFLRQNYDMVATYLNQLKVELVEQQDAEFALRAK
ncbi:transcriptional regulator, partial [Lacticaseibacillus paracasei]